MRDRQLVADLVSDIALPKMFKVKQVFPRPRIEPEEIPDIIRKNLLIKYSLGCVLLLPRVPGELPMWH